MLYHLLSRDDDGNVSERLSAVFQDSWKRSALCHRIRSYRVKYLDKWVIDGTDTEVTKDTIVNEPMTVEAVFSAVSIYDIDVEYYYLNDSKQEVVFNEELLQVEAHELPYTITAPTSTQTDPNQVATGPIYYPETPSVEVKESDFDTDKKPLLEFKYVPYTAVYDYVIYAERY